MATLENLEDYFKGSDIPPVHPFQKVENTNTFNQGYNEEKAKEKQFGYKPNGNVENANTGSSKTKKKK